jgi:glycosyltransferase involved in cell wall biosynthesis
MMSKELIVSRRENNAVLVSVVVPSYNHEKYLEKAVESVLSQGFTNFELLISDDGSTDNSWDVIQGFSDSRITIFQQERNLGPVGNLVFLIKKSKGKYIALLNSDDSWKGGKLRKQVEIMESDESLGACFTWADLVDGTGHRINGEEAVWSDVFLQSNRSQGQWLRHFFYKGNCLCHPSLLIRREIYDELGYYNPAIKQLPDFEMWIRLIKKYPIHVIPESLVAHLRTGENTSSLNKENTARNLTELVDIFAEFFNNIDDEIFIDGFSNEFRLKNVSMSPERIFCEKLFLLLDSAFAHHSGRIAAFNWFYKAFRNPDIEKVLSQEYCFSVSDFYKLTGNSGFGNTWISAMDNNESASQDKAIFLISNLKNFWSNIYSYKIKTFLKKHFSS